MYHRNIELHWLKTKKRTFIKYRMFLFNWRTRLQPSGWTPNGKPSRPGFESSLGQIMVISPFFSLVVGHPVANLADQGLNPLLDELWLSDLSFLMKQDDTSRQQVII
jgi:hypothetical protein